MNGFSNNDGSHINGSDFIQRQANDYTGGLTNSTSADHMQDVTRSGRQIPVVICGLAMRLPGGIRDDRALYDFLINKGDARSIIGQDRYNVDAYYNAHGKHGTISTKYGYFLNDVDFSNFDTALLLFSANHPESLSRVAADIENYCRNHPDHLDDLAYTLAHRREHLKLRTYCVVGDPSAPFAISDQAKSQGLHQIAFIFTGQGAQW